MLQVTLIWHDYLSWLPGALVSLFRIYQELILNKKISYINLVMKILVLKERDLTLFYVNKNAKTRIH